MKKTNISKLVNEYRSWVDNSPSEKLPIEKHIKGKNGVDILLKIYISSTGISVIYTKCFDYDRRNEYYPTKIDEKILFKFVEALNTICEDIPVDEHKKSSLIVRKIKSIFYKKDRKSVADISKEYKEWYSVKPEVRNIEYKVTESVSLIYDIPSNSVIINKNKEELVNSRIGLNQVRQITNYLNEAITGYKG